MMEGTNKSQKETQASTKENIYSNFHRSAFFIIEANCFHILCKKNPEILDNVNTPRHTMKDTHSSYRAVNHWESLGLIDSNRIQAGQGWRKFSILDVLWLSILENLRNFGLSSDKIKVTKNCLDRKIASNDPPLTWLEFAFCRTNATTKGGNTYLLIFDTGDAVVTCSDEINLNRFLRSLPDSYITINLNRLFINVLKIPGVTEITEHWLKLSEEERNVMSCIRKSHADKISIKAKDGKILLIEKTFEGKKSDFKSIHELIDGINYGEATLKIENGKIVYVQALKKEKLGREK